MGDSRWTCAAELEEFEIQAFLIFIIVSLAIRPTPSDLVLF